MDFGVRNRLSGRLADIVLRKPLRSSRGGSSEVLLTIAELMLIRPQVLPLRAKVIRVRMDVAAILGYVLSVRSNVALVSTDIVGIRTDRAAIPAEVLPIRLDIALVGADVASIGADGALVLANVFTVRLDIPIIRPDVIGIRAYVSPVLRKVLTVGVDVGTRLIERIRLILAVPLLGVLVAQIPLLIPQVRLVTRDVGPVRADVSLVLCRAFLVDIQIGLVPRDIGTIRTHIGLVLGHAFLIRIEVGLILTAIGPIGPDIRLILTQALLVGAEVGTIIRDIGPVTSHIRVIFRHGALVTVQVALQTVATAVLIEVTAMTLVDVRVMMRGMSLILILVHVPPISSQISLIMSKVLTVATNVGSFLFDRILLVVPLTLLLIILVQSAFVRPQVGLVVGDVPLIRPDVRAILIHVVLMSILRRTGLTHGRLIIQRCRAWSADSGHRCIRGWTRLPHTRRVGLRSRTRLAHSRSIGLRRCLRLRICAR